jgi:hypothetical protein
MADLQTIQSTTSSAARLTLLGAEATANSSLGTTRASQHIQQRIIDLGAITKTTYRQDREGSGGDIERKLFETLAEFKIRTSQVAMHLDGEWRSRLFRQLDSLLDPAEWDRADMPPTAASFRTFLRMILSRNIEVRPGLGASADGHLIAAWTTGDAKLTVECLPNDQIRWSIARTVEGQRERAAGISLLKRMSAVLQPYDPRAWFSRG